MMKKYAKFAKLLLSFGILVYLFRHVDIKVLLAQFTQLNFLIFILAFLILILQCALSSLKWRIILKADGKTVPFLFLLKSYLIGNFISLFLPSSFGGDLYRIYALKKYSKDYLQNTSSVLFDRVSGLFALASLSIISYIFFLKAYINYPFLFCYLFGVIFFWILTSDKTISFIDNYNIKFLDLIKRILESFNKYRKNWRVLLFILLISFAFQSNIVFLNKIYCSALNININLSFLFVVIPLIYLTEALPISINGLGVREGAFVFFFQQAGYEKIEALAVGLLVISMRYLFSITFGGTLFFREFFRKKFDS
jgi:uncharacterized protein (TIRG00374 family)